MSIGVHSWFHCASLKAKPDPCSSTTHRHESTRIKSGFRNWLQRTQEIQRGSEHSIDWLGSILVPSIQSLTAFLCASLCSLRRFRFGVRVKAGFVQGSRQKCQHPSNSSDQFARHPSFPLRLIRVHWCSFVVSFCFVPAEGVTVRRQAGSLSYFSL